MISHNASEGCYSPEICLMALGQELLHSEANIAAHDNFRRVCQRRAGVADHSGSFNGSQRNSGEACRSQGSFQRVEEAKEEVWRYASRTRE
jgi:hypothetical protein